MPSPYVFFIYSRQDGDFAARLTADLQSKGIQTWNEPREPTVAAGHGDTATSALQQAHAVLFVASPASVTSACVLDELRLAREAKRRVIPLCVNALEDTLPGELAGETCVDFSAGYAPALERLIAVLLAPTTRVTPPHAYYAYGPAPDPNAWSTFPGRSSAAPGERAHATYPYLAERPANVPARHSLDPMNAGASRPDRGRSGVAVAFACVAVAASVVVFAAVLGGANKAQRVAAGSFGATLAPTQGSHVLSSEEWLGTWQSACEPGPDGTSSLTTLTVETTRIVAEVSDCVADPPSVLRFEWRLDATRSRGDGLHELDMHFERLQALPRRTALEWNATGKFGRHDWADGVPRDIAPRATSAGITLEPGEARHELAALRDGTLSVAGSLSSGRAKPSPTRPGAAEARTRFTRLVR
jgi:hypothetical protein